MPKLRPFHHTRTRQMVSRFFGFAALGLAVATQSHFLNGGWTPQILGWLGLLLVVTGVFGRLLSTIFIGGHKTHTLVMEGPYGLTRNPLYFFSLLGVLGLGVTSANPAVAVLLLAAFSLYYPGVLAREEEKLAKEHGDLYAAYRERVPRFWPRLGLGWREPRWVETSPNRFRWALADGFAFVAAYLVFRIVAEAHAEDLLPAYPLPCC